MWHEDEAPGKGLTADGVGCGLIIASLPNTGGFSPTQSFVFDPTALTWAQVASTVESRFDATTLLIGDGRALALYGPTAKSIEAYTHGAGWGPPALLPAPPLTLWKRREGFLQLGEAEQELRLLRLRRGSPLVLLPPPVRGRPPRLVPESAVGTSSAGRAAPASATSCIQLLG